MRVSGRQARTIAESAGPPEIAAPALACLLRRTAGMPGGDLVDEVVVTFFAAPRSYTAEDLVEIACHGAPVVLRHCLERALQSGARLAEPGEFTLRAFLNGRIDLPQAEAVRDLIEATTLYQARIAALQTQGSVSKRLSPVKAQLVDLIALLEAGIDFAEDDISVAPTSEILTPSQSRCRTDRATRPQLHLRQSGARGLFARHRGPSQRGEKQLIQPPAGTGSRYCHGYSRNYPRFSFGNHGFRRNSRPDCRYRRHSRGGRTD